MGKPRERDPTQATPVSAFRLLHPCVKSRSSRLLFPQKAINPSGTVEWAMWSAPFSRNLETEFEIFVGVYSRKRCKSLWSATGPVCHAALCSAEITGGRSGPSVLKKDLWERRKGSQCQISPFFSTSPGHSSCSHDFRSDFFRCLFQPSFPSHHHTSQPTAQSLLQIPVSAWTKHASFFLQDSSHSPVLLTSFFHAVSRVVSG